MLFIPLSCPNFIYYIYKFIINSIMSDEEGIPIPFETPLEYKEIHRNNILLNEASENSEELQSALSLPDQIDNLKYYYFLKQYSDIFELYDELNPNLEKELGEYFKDERIRSNLNRKTRNLTTALVGFGSVLLFTKLKGLKVLSFNTYISEIYNVLLIGGGSGFLMNFIILQNSLFDYHYLNYYNNTFNNRSLLHSKITLLSQEMTNQFDFI